MSPYYLNSVDLNCAKCLRYLLNREKKEANYTKGTFKVVI